MKNAGKTVIIINGDNNTVNFGEPKSRRPVVLAIIAGVVIVATTTTVEARAATVAAAGDQKKYDDEEPDYVVIIEKIAKTIHKYPPFAAQDGDFIKK